MSRAHELRAALDAFDQIDETERGHLAAIERLLATSAAPLSRHSFDPGHITASAFIVDPTGERLLLHHHRRLGRWLQMGGHVDAGERVIDAALREACEESGLEELTFADPAPFDLDVHPIPAGKGEPAHHHFDVRWIVRAANPAAIRLAPDESRELRWFTLDEAIEAMNSPESKRAIGKILRQVKGQRS